MHFPLTLRPAATRSRTAADRRLLTNEDGSTAIEFGMVGLPFLLFVFAIIGYGLYFFSESSLEYGAEAASRKIRTGEVNSAGTTRPDKQLTVGEFQRQVCIAAGALIDCSKLRIQIQVRDSWAQISPPSCTKSNGDMSDSTGGANDVLSKYSGSASQIVMVTLCYKPDISTTLSFLKLPAIIQAATAFKSEPYS